MNRRTFIGWIAKAAVGAVALKVLPASALPLKGELHEAIRDGCLAKVRKAIRDHRDKGIRPFRLRRVDANPDFWEQMSGEMRAHQRIMFGGVSSDDWDHLLVSGVKVARNPAITGFTFELVTG